MKKQDAILFGPFVGELWWEIFRFAAMLPFYKLSKYKDKDIKYIVYTRPDRFDIYGAFADILVPLEIKDEKDKYYSDCYKLRKFPDSEYYNLAEDFNKYYKTKYNILEHVFPDISRKRFLAKNQFNTKHMIFKVKPRKDNIKIVNKIISNNKPIILLASRYRKFLRRNWNGWEDLFNMIYSDSWLMDTFNFVICGKSPDYIPDPKNRFYDINYFPTTTNTSTIGFLYALMLKENTILTVGSQSGIPNISMLFKVEVLEWGHQKELHTKSYNIFNTKVNFLEDNKYNLPAKKIFNTMVDILKRKQTKNLNV